SDKGNMDMAGRHAATPVGSNFDAISLDRLRERRSEKWATYPPDILPAFVAEMDFDLAAPIRDAIDEAVARGDVGYAHSAEVAGAFVAFARGRFARGGGETH